MVIYSVLQFLMPHCRMSIIILQIDLESMLETMSTKLPLIYIRQRKFTQDGNLGDGNLVHKVHLSDYYSSLTLQLSIMSVSVAL